MDDQELLRLAKADPTVLKRLRKAAASEELPPEVAQPPKFVFEFDESTRSPGDPCQVTNGFDRRAGVVERKIGRAYYVEIEEARYIVHEPRDAWADHAQEAD